MLVIGLGWFSCFVLLKFGVGHNLLFSNIFILFRTVEENSKKDKSFNSGLFSVRLNRLKSWTVLSSVSLSKASSTARLWNIWKTVYQYLQRIYLPVCGCQLVPVLYALSLSVSLTFDKDHNQCPVTKHNNFKNNFFKKKTTWIITQMFWSYYIWSIENIKCTVSV